MNKTALKTFATEARKELLERIKTKAMQLGITEESSAKADIASSNTIFINGKQLVDHEIVQRNKLISRINEIGFERVMDEVAYTWFNRFTALRFMEVNDYLPTRTRVLSSEGTPGGEPDMMKEALTLDLDLDKELVYKLMVNNDTDELFKYLIKEHCNDLNRYMPFMFEPIEGYTAILFPDGLLAPDSFLRKMINTEVIPEEDWEQIEIIGWMYQYYNTEMNEMVYDGNMSKSRIPKELLPAATQLFTPDWAVKYMVENSLGRLWLEGHTDEDLKNNWKYYLDKIDQETDQKEHFVSINAENEQLSPEDIKILDPCMGSGHILVYAFELLMQIYESRGYLQRDAAKLILEKNLYGIEIDDRAYQLACFAVVMKARKYNRRIFDDRIELNLCSVVESNWITNIDTNEIKNYLGDKDSETFNYLITVYKDAKEYGSILNVNKMDYDSLQNAIDNMDQNKFGDLFQNQLLSDINEAMPKLVKQAQVMTQKYDVVITNPPYLGSSRMSPLLNEYVTNYFPTTKSDLSTVMYQKTISSYSKPAGFISFITTSSWFFLKSFEKFREEVLETVEFSSIVDFGTELFDGKVGHNPIVSWVNRNSMPKNKIVAIRLVDFCYSMRNQKEAEFFNLENRYYPKQENFSKIPGSPISYWATEGTMLSFSNEPLASIASPKRGLCTCANDRFYKYWMEINFLDIDFEHQKGESFNMKWIPLNKGGEFRKWYGNLWEVVDWKNNGERLRNFPSAQIKNEDYYFLPAITWSSITSGKFSIRCTNKGFIFDQASNGVFPPLEKFNYIAGLLNSKVAISILNLINPSINILVGDIAKIPFIYDENKKIDIDSLVSSNIEISKRDWDSFEKSWNYKEHPFLFYRKSNLIKDAFELWEQEKSDQFSQLKANEEELNRYFIDIYSLQEQLTSTISDEDVTIHKADLERDVKSFISYAIGCSFGRYSLNEEGLIYAGGDFDPSRYETFHADEDNILPILPGAYFEDDIVTRFVEFVRMTYGQESLSENLDFVADMIVRRKNETARETLRRYFMNDFYKDHVQTYKKRPIYWQFTSGKEKAFNCLIYMHRYDKSTLSRIRTDYLHEYQVRLDSEKEDLMEIINGGSTTKEINDAKRELKSLDKKIAELKKYDEVLHHMADMQIEIDLDDGVKVNYEKFKGLVAKI